MRAVVTRVSEASVSIAGQTVGSIGRGFLVLLGVGPQDTQAVLSISALPSSSLTMAPTPQASAHGRRLWDMAS